MSQFGYKDAVGYCVESFGKAKIDDTHHSSVIHRPSHFILEGNQGRRSQFTLGKSMWTILSHHLLLHGPRKAFKENLIHDFPRDQNEADRLVVKHQKNQTLPFSFSQELKQN